MLDIVDARELIALLYTIVHVFVELCELIALLYFDREAWPTCSTPLRAHDVLRPRSARRTACQPVPLVLRVIRVWYRPLLRCLIVRRLQ